MCKRIALAVLLGLSMGIPACIWGYQARRAQLRWDYYNVPQGSWTQLQPPARLSHIVSGVSTADDDGGVDIHDSAGVVASTDEGMLYAVTCDDAGCTWSIWDAPSPNPEDDLLGGFCMDDYDSTKLPKKPPAPGKIVDCYDITYTGSDHAPWIMYFILLDDGSVAVWSSAVKGIWMAEGMQAIGAGLLWGAIGTVLGVLVGVALPEVVVRIREKRRRATPGGTTDAI